MFVELDDWYDGLGTVLRYGAAAGAGKGTMGDTPSTVGAALGSVDAEAAVAGGATGSTLGPADGRLLKLSGACMT